MRGGKPRSTHVSLGATALGVGPGFGHSCSFGLKKVPTRTGPRCAPSACNPC